MSRKREIRFVNFTNLCEDDLLYILSQRNSPKIRSAMTNQQIITKEEHLQFCRALPSDESKLYFLILVDGIKCGVLDYQNIDIEKHTYEPGCYFFDECDLKLRTSILYASVFIRIKFKLFFPTIRVRKENTQALIFNTMKMGCTIYREDDEFYYLKNPSEPSSENELIQAFESGFEITQKYFDLKFDL